MKVPIWEMIVGRKRGSDAKETLQEKYMKGGMKTVSWYCMSLALKVWEKLIWLTFWVFECLQILSESDTKLLPLIRLLLTTEIESSNGLFPIVKE